MVDWSSESHRRDPFSVVFLVHSTAVIVSTSVVRVKVKVHRGVTTLVVLICTNCRYAYYSCMHVRVLVIVLNRGWLSPA